MNGRTHLNEWYKSNSFNKQKKKKKRKKKEIC